MTASLPLPHTTLPKDMTSVLDGALFCTEAHFLTGLRSWSWSGLLESRFTETTMCETGVLVVVKTAGAPTDGGTMQGSPGQHALCWCHSRPLEGWKTQSSSQCWVSYLSLALDNWTHLYWTLSIHQYTSILLYTIFLAKAKKKKKDLCPQEAYSLVAKE